MAVTTPEGRAMITVLAVYENGVLRPAEPLPLAEGQNVQLTVHPRPPFLNLLRQPTPEEQAYLDRLKAAKTMQELIAVMQTAPPAEDFDVLKAINETRRQTGFRMPDPEPQEEEPR